MTTLMTRERGTQRGSRLGDLGPGGGSTWLDNRALAALVLEAVRSVDEKELSPPAPSAPGPGHGSRLLLAALTYFYSLGVFASQDIEESMRKDAGFRALCGMEFPDWRRLRKFRREHRGVLRDALKNTLRGMWRMHPAAGSQGESGQRATRPEVDASGTEWFSRRAEDLIEQAMFVDQCAED